MWGLFWIVMALLLRAIALHIWDMIARPATIQEEHDYDEPN